MKRPFLGVLVAMAACAPLAAQASDEQRWRGWKPYEVTYLNTYEKCWPAFKADCGRNIVDDDLASGKTPPQSVVEASTARMQGWLNPPEPVATVAYEPGVAPVPATASVAPASTGGMGCTGMEAESGSLGYANNTNPDYIGCYQIAEMHYAPGGLCAGGSTDPAGQDACAATICNEQGTGAWTNAAGANPC